MRALFLLLLLAEPAVPGLDALGGRSTVGNAVFQRRHAAGTTPIRLRQEVAGDAGDATARRRRPEQEPLLEAACVSLGPFVEPATVECGVERLRQLGFVARRARRSTRSG